MFGLIFDLLFAMSCDLPYALAYKRLRHERYSHPFDKSALIQKFKSEMHPHSCDEFVFTINMRRCDSCGLIYFDNGMEYRDRTKIMANG